MNADDPGLMDPLDVLLLALFRDDRTEEERQQDEEMVRRIVERAQKEGEGCDARLP